MTIRRWVFALLLIAPLPLAAQTGGEGVPPLDVEDITVVGTRVIRLPAARKGEVVDSSRYQLPPGDSLMFGDRVSNFGGPGGVLPGYREFDPPATANIEGSFGTLLSPRVRAHGEYVQRPFDAMGTFEYAATAGHVDSADATSLLLELGGGMLFSAEDPTAPRLRVAAGFELARDEYTLFGSSVTPFDRSRSALRVDTRVHSAQDGLVDYDLYFRLDGSSVEDQLRDARAEASASTPGFGLTLGAGDDTLRGRVSVDYQITTLRYDSAQTTPNFVAVSASAEWRPSEPLSVVGGLSYYGGQHSDSGSATLIAPRISARYAAAPGVTLFAAFSPEMRPASYRAMLMRSPYVDREITLRPERVPMSLAVGGRMALGDDGVGSVEARLLFERAENTPVVAAGAERGSLRWTYVESRTLGVSVSGRYQATEALQVDADLHIRSAVDAATDAPLPMVPPLELSLGATYALTPSLALDARASYQGERRAALGSDAAAESTTVGGRPLIDLNGTFQLGSRLELFAGVSNLLDQEFEWWRGYPAPGIELRAGARLNL